MANYNRVIMMGNLTRDPEHKQLSSGQAVCRLGLASNRQFKNKQTGNLVQEVCFVDVEVWGPQAESCRQYLSKGRSVLIEGRLKMDSWQEESGAKRVKHLIVADRVTFLAAGSSVEDNDETSGLQGSDFIPATTQSSNQNEVEVTKLASTKRVAKTSMLGEATNSSGEIDFKDQPPFTDELPF